MTLLSVALVLGGAALGTSAAAVGSAGLIGPTPPLASLGPTTGPAVAITSISPQVLTPQDELVVGATVRNATSTKITHGSVQLRVNRFRATTRADVAAWADAEAGADAGSVIATAVLDDPLAPGATTTVSLRVLGANIGLLDLPDTWGPRGLAVELTDAGRRIGLDRSFILWKTTSTLPQTRVSIVVPVVGNAVDYTPAATPVEPATSATATSSPTADPDPAAGTAAATKTSAALTAGALAPLVAPQGRLDAVLRATADRPGVSWAVDPAIVEAGSTSDDPALKTWAAELTASLGGRDVFALPWSDPDLAALAHGDGRRLATEATSLTTTKAASVLGRSPRLDLAWPAGGAQDQSTVTLARRIGASIVIASSSALAPVKNDPAATPTGRTSIETTAGPVVALIPDAGLTEHFVSPKGSTPATVAQRLLAETAVISHGETAETPHVVIALPRDWNPDVETARAQLAALDAAPWVSSLPLSALLGGSEPAVARTKLPDRAAGDDELDAITVRALAEQYSKLVDFAPVVTDPKAFVGEIGPELLAPVSVAWRSLPGTRATLSSTVLTAAAGRIGGLSVIPGSNINLISKAGDLPVVVRNVLTADATVLVELRPESGKLVAASPVSVTVPAGGDISVRIPVKSVANGDVRVDVVLLAPGGAVVAPTSSFDVRVRADWENLGTAAIAALLAVALVLGIIRTVRRGRTGTRVDAQDVPQLGSEVTQ